MQGTKKLFWIVTPLILELLVACTAVSASFFLRRRGGRGRRSRKLDPIFEGFLNLFSCFAWILHRFLEIFKKYL